VGSTLIKGGVDLELGSFLDVKKATDGQERESWREEVMGMKRFVVGKARSNATEKKVVIRKGLT
jgi:hypothetical protein